MNIHTALKPNQAGASPIITIIAIVAIIAIGFVGYRIGVNQDQDAGVSQSTVRDEESVVEDQRVPNDTELDIAEDWMLVTPTSSSDEYSVRAPKGLLPSGTCTSGEILFGIIYNSDSYDYDCNNLNSALGYASIVFGASSKSVASDLGAVEEARDVMLADGVTTVKKHAITAQETGPGGPVRVRYIVYEVDSQKTTNQSYYAVYKMLVGASDEDYYLQDFESTVTNGWTITEYN